MHEKLKEILFFWLGNTPTFLLWALGFLVFLTWTSEIDSLLASVLIGLSVALVVYSLDRLLGQRWWDWLHDRFFDEAYDPPSNEWFSFPGIRKDDAMFVLPHDAQSRGEVSSKDISGSFVTVWKQFFLSIPQLEDTDFSYSTSEDHTVEISSEGYREFETVVLEFSKNGSDPYAELSRVCLASAVDPVEFDSAFCEVFLAENKKALGGEGITATIHELDLKSFRESLDKTDILCQSFWGKLELQNSDNVASVGGFYGASIHFHLDGVFWGFVVSAIRPLDRTTATAFEDIVRSIAIPGLGHLGRLPIFEAGFLGSQKQPVTETN